MKHADKVASGLSGIGGNSRQTAPSTIEHTLKTSWIT
jgi:hypothetical protein